MTRSGVRSSLAPPTQYTKADPRGSAFLWAGAGRDRSAASVCRNAYDAVDSMTKTICTAEQGQRAARVRPKAAPGAFDLDRSQTTQPLTIAPGCALRLPGLLATDLSSPALAKHQTSIFHQRTCRTSKPKYLNIFVVLPLTTGNASLLYQPTSS